MKTLIYCLSLLLSLFFYSQTCFAAFTSLGKDLSAEQQQQIRTMVQGAAMPKADELVHIPPTMDDLEKTNMHAELKKTIQRGHDLFVNTQQLYGKNIFNNMNCSSCHLGDGRLPNSGPVWPAAVTLPDFRGKNGHVNSLEERIAGCFTFSMNGKAPAYNSPDMVAIAAYIQWLAKGVPMYPDQKLYGRGFPRLADSRLKPDAERGKVAYQSHCTVCHGDDGAGKKSGQQVVFPALWGDDSFNWGAGISRVYTLAAFIRYNMPLGSPNTISVQDAWNIAQYVDSQERPQDPRFTGDLEQTYKKYYKTFYKHSMYGQTYQGKVLGDHHNTGHRK